MKLSVLGLSVAIALAGLTSPLDAASTRSSNGFTSHSTDTRSRRDRDPPAAADKPAAQPQTRQSGGFTANHTAEPDKAPPPTAQAPRQNGGFTARDNTPPQPQAGAQRTANGFGGGAGAVAAAKPPPSAVDRIADRHRSIDAFKQFQQERAVYKAPPVAEPVNQAAARSSAGWRTYGSGWHNPDAYYSSRNAAFVRSPEYRVYYEHPPIWVQNSSPSYGWIAAGFLGGVLLDRATQPGYGEWAYSHQNDPGYESWHRDMMQQAADNEELRTKMAALDAQVAELQAKNAPKTEALPPGVDPSLVVAPSTALIATTEEDSGFPWIKTILFTIVGVLCFLGLCVFISQRKRAIA